MSLPPKLASIRAREGDPGHGSGVSRSGANHPIALPDKPHWLSAEAGDVWDEYCRFAAPTLLRLVHAMALAQLCEDKVLEYRLRRAIGLREEIFSRAAERALVAQAETGNIVDSRDILPGGPLAAVAQDEEGTRLFRVLNQIVIRVQRQEQQFGLTPQSASKIDLSEASSVSDSLNDALCG